MNIATLKSLNLDRILDIDEAVGWSADIRLLQDEFSTLDMAEPDWLAATASSIREEIARRTHASDLATLKKVEAELDGYRTVGEKRAAAQQRLAELQKKLGMVTPGSKRK
jgi:hypothetical protein